MKKLPSSTAGKISALTDMIEAGVIDQEMALEFFLGCKDYTVEDWLESSFDITEGQLERYPNAKAAKKIMDSKLFKVMK